MLSLGIGGKILRRPRTNMDLKNYSGNDLQCQLLLYLDKRRYLITMKNASEKFLEQLTDKTVCRFPPFKYVLEIDVMDLLDMFPDVGDFLIKEPLKLQRLCNEILFACLQSTNNDYNQSVDRAQVSVTLRFKCVPRYLVRPNLRSFKGLMCIEGLLTAVSKPLNYVNYCIWSCPEQCEGNEIILHYLPKNPPKCYVCRSLLFENSCLRRCGEHVIATLKLKNDLLPKTLTIADDLITQIKLGGRYLLYAVAMKKVTAVWSLEPVNLLQAPMPTAIPPDIEELFNVCEGLPWKFIYCLASSIGVNVCPLNCFMHLKISLLLSLTSVKANSVTGSNIIHVLAAGFDTTYVGDIMIEAAKLAENVVCLGTANAAVPTSLIGSNRGVCVMPLPFHDYNKKQTSSILTAIESGEITTDTHKTNLQCAIWAQGMDFKKFVLFNIASVFGTVCRGDYGEYNEELIDFMVQNAEKPADASQEAIQALRDVALYIDLVAVIEVALEKSTESLLRNYFIAARKKKPRGITIGSMGALVTSCLTSARLCRRKGANIDDALFAIWLHVSASPEPRLAPDEYLQTPADVKKIQKIMVNFKDWLQQFIDSYIL